MNFLICLQTFYMSLLFPCCPNKIVLCKIFTLPLLPPISLFQHIFYNSWIVAETHPKLFKCSYWLHPWTCWHRIVRCLSILLNLNLLVEVSRHIVGLKDSGVKLIVHFCFECQNEISRVKKFSQSCLAIKLFWYCYVHQFNNFWKF